MNPSSPAASRHNLASAPIVGFLVEYVYYDHQYEEKVYWTSVSRYAIKEQNGRINYNTCKENSLKDNGFAQMAMLIIIF